RGVAVGGIAGQHVLTHHPEEVLGNGGGGGGGGGEQAGAQRERDDQGAKARLSVSGVRVLGAQAPVPTSEEPPRNLKRLQPRSCSSVSVKALRAGLAVLCTVRRPVWRPQKSLKSGAYGAPSRQPK